MKKKICLIILAMSLFLMLLVPCITSIGYNNLSVNLSNVVYDSGCFILVSPNIEGVEEGLNIGGMHDLNITTNGGKNTFLILTKPIWGSTIITNLVDINIQIHVSVFFHSSIFSCLIHSDLERNNQTA